jgi:DNA-binding MarR family transcriptional regulator
MADYSKVMNTEYQIKIKGLGNLTKLLSSFFQITRKEAQVLAALMHIMDEQKTDVVTKEVRIELANMSNFSTQIVTNYVNQLRKKKALNKDYSIHPILNSKKIIFNYE